MTGASTVETSDFRVETLGFQSCAARVRAFRNRNRAVARTAEYFTWRYARKPLPEGAPGAFITWTIGPEGTDAGAVSVIPHRYVVNGRPAVFGLLGDISVAPEFKGRGLATRMLLAVVAAATERGFDGCFVIPNVDVSGALARAGFARVSALQRYVLLVDPSGRFFPRRGLAGALASAVSLPWSLLLRAASWRAALKDGVIQSGVAPDKGVDELWGRLRLDAMVAAARDLPAVRWRFVERPKSEYLFHSLEIGGRLEAWLVAHVDGDWVCIDDLICSEPRYAATLMAQFANQVRGRRLGHSIEVCSTGFGMPCQFLPGPLWSRRQDGPPVMYLGLRTADLATGSAWMVTPADKDV